MHIIKNNQPQYVVLSEERYRELVEAEDEAYNARIRESLADLKAGRVKRGTAKRFDKRIEAGRLRDVYPRLDSTFYPLGREIQKTSSGTEEESRQYSTRPGKRPISATSEVSLPRGKYKGMQAISITDSYRITMTIMITEKEIHMIDIGTHDEVYG